MRKKSLLILLFINLFSFFIFSETQKIGLTRVYSSYKKIESDFILELEDHIMASIVENPSKEFYSLNIEEKLFDLKKVLKSWRDESDDGNNSIINELKEVDYCFAFDIPQLQIQRERDFYDSDKFWTVFKLKLHVMIIDSKNRTYMDEDNLIISFKTKSSKDAAKEEGIKNTVKKFSSYVEEVTVFKLKVHPVKIKPLFVWLDAGKSQGIKAQNVLVSYEQNRFTLIEHTVLRIIKSDENKSLASIEYTKGDLTADQFFTKANKINLEIQLSGGFSLADKDNPVDTATEYASILSFASIRALIPVGIPFFRPGFQVEFNFFYIDNKLLLPFSFEAGCQAEYRIHRFETDLGLMVGALFSPDANSNYQLDSVVVRPYLHLSALLNTTVKLFGEVGYKFVMEGTLYQNWSIDLKGVYFSFGLGLNI